MRAGLCTVSAPLAACSPAGALPPAARFLALHLLHQQTIYFIVQAKSRVRELYHQTCLHLAQQGMLDTDLFGLALICDGEYLFAEPDSKLSKYAPKSWRSSHSHGLDANGRPALAFYFRVQYYVDSPLLLRDETTRQHYYLQLRLNMATGTGAAGQDTASRLAGLALQADLDNRTENTVFRPEDYVPSHMREPAAIHTIENAHRSLRNVSKEEARSRFIADACQIQDPVNAHVFKLRASKHEACPGSLLLAVCARGLQVSPENNPPSMFLWSSIGKLSFERKKFEIRTGHEKITLYTTSDEKSRLLLALCKATHQFSMAIAPKLTEAKKIAEEKLKWCGDQRTSVISSTSSNTTSGIVSDRVHSEDELEIMITSPPAAPAQSTESLALAHLLDSTPSSSRASAASSIGNTAAFILPATTNDAEEDDTQSAKLTLSESSAKTVASNRKCTGSSQCSSSGSTIVQTQIQNKAKGRRPSTSSSLELGYSHTAQNSIISDTTCIESDVNAVYTAGVATSSHTSGVYTMTSSEEYTISSSDQYAIASGEYSLTNEQYSCSTASEQYSVPSEQYSVASSQSDSQYNTPQAGEYSAIDAYRGKTTCISRIPDEYCITEEYEQYNISSEFISEEDLDDKNVVASEFGSKYNLRKLRKSPAKERNKNKHKRSALNEEFGAYNLQSVNEKCFRHSEDDFKRAISKCDASSDCDEVYEEYNIPNNVNEEFEEYAITNENYDDKFNTPGVPTSADGLFEPVDTVDGFRNRSNSNISNSGSFRGDGSDPTDTQTLLSARELSDLIVGRYPSRKSVSDTLNSDSDYVTLPLNYSDFPPVPPKRIDSVDTRFRQTDCIEPIYSETISPQIPLETTAQLERPPPPPYSPKTNYDRDPPPYPDNAPMLPPPPVYPTQEEANARFITTGPPNMLTAFTSLQVNNSPNFAQPNYAQANANFVQMNPNYIQLTNSSFSQSNFSQANSSFSKPNSSFSSVSYAPSVFTNVPTPPPVPPKIPTIYTPNNYLDIAASKASVLVPCTYIPPPPVTPRQPPPAPPLATVYTSQLTRSQIEQYHQQMYSDVDFVVFPLKEPAISKQEYLEAKQGSLLAALAHQHVFYRSTPHLSQNLSDTYVQLPVYGAPSSTGSLDLVPPPLPPNKFMRTRSDDNILNSLELPPQCPKFRRLPPPPPPLPEKRHATTTRRTAMGSLSEKRNILQSSLAEKHLDSKLMHGRNKSGVYTMVPLTISERIEKTPQKRHSLIRNLTHGSKNGLNIMEPNRNEIKASTATPLISSDAETTPNKANNSPETKNTPLDIRTLREKSKKMDLPLISALCNDRSLIKQTKAFVMPKHATDVTPRVATNSKYPVSGLSSKGINKQMRKSTSVSHRHPGDKLPEIPCEKITDIQRAKPNNYVITDPRPAGKHKTMQSHS